MARKATDEGGGVPKKPIKYNPAGSVRTGKPPSQSPPPQQPISYNGRTFPGGYYVLNPDGSIAATPAAPWGDAYGWPAPGARTPVSYPGGGSEPSGYYDRNYGAYRSGGELVGGSMNRFGQPLGTMAPIQVSGPRGRGSPGRTYPVTAEIVQEQLKQTESYLRNEKERLANKPKGRTGRDHWDPLGYRLRRLQKRKEILKNLAKQLGVDEGAGIQSGAAAQMVRWNL